MADINLSVLYGKSRRSTITCRMCGGTDWLGSGVQNRLNSLNEDPMIKPPDFDFPRTVWTTLDRISTEQGKHLNYLTHKWRRGAVESPLGSCRSIHPVIRNFSRGERSQTRRFILEGTGDDPHDRSRSRLTIKFLTTVFEF